MTLEQSKEFMGELANFGQTIAKNFSPEDAVLAIRKLNELTKSNPQMVRDISKFENWGNLQNVAQNIGDGLFKGKKPSLKDIFLNIGKIEKQVKKAINP